MKCLLNCSYCQQDRPCALVTLLLVLVVMGFLLLGAATTHAQTLQLNWTAGAVNADNSNAPVGFRLYRRLATASYDLLPATVPWVAGTTSYSVVDATSLSMGALYCYRATSYNYALSGALQESPPSNEACAAPIVGEMVAVNISGNRTPLISRRVGDTSSIVSFLVNKSDTVAVNDSVAAVTANMTINTPPGKSVLVSHRATDGSSLLPMLVNHSTVVYFNSQVK